MTREVILTRYLVLCSDFHVATNESIYVEYAGNPEVFLKTTRALLVYLVVYVYVEVYLIMGVIISV